MRCSRCAMLCSRRAMLCSLVFVPRQTLFAANIQGEGHTEQKGDEAAAFSPGHQVLDLRWPAATDVGEGRDTGSGPHQSAIMTVAWGKEGRERNRRQTVTLPRCCVSYLALPIMLHILSLALLLCTAAVAVLASAPQLPWMHDPTVPQRERRADVFGLCQWLTFSPSRPRFRLRPRPRCGLRC